MRPGFSFWNLLTQSVRIKSGSAFHNLADTEVRKRNKTMTGCSRFIEGQNVSFRQHHDKKTGEKTQLGILLSIWLEIFPLTTFTSARALASHFTRASLVLLKLPRTCPKRILGNSAIPRQGNTPDFIS